ncbi:MAG: single-stranded DNA-binding protein [Deltaproteobacteria bacterium]|jgi:single-strand DNA-binding protein|nr:single-stranded DNA-binding protein [Deltaproteobacteria bacterium]
MASVNKVILIGHLGRDPEMRSTQTGKKITTFSLATTERWNNEDHVEWHKIVLWERLAEIAKEYLRKGSQVYIEGRLQTRNWEDQNGIKRQFTDVIANSLVMLSSRRDSQPGYQSNYGGSPPREPREPRELREPREDPAPPSAAAPLNKPAPVVEEYPIEDDTSLPADSDLPF